MKTIKLTLATVLVGSLVACGGGGDTAAGNASTGTINFAAHSGLNAYTAAQGVSDLAPLTTTNHADFVYLLLFSVIESDSKAAGYVWRSDNAVQPGTGMDGRIVAPKALGPDTVSDEIVNLLEEATAHKPGQARYDNSGTISCPGGGNVVIAGDVDSSTSAGVLTAQYTDCYDASGSIRKQGVATVSVTKRDPTNGTYVDYTVDYNGLTVEFSSTGAYFVYTGSQHTVRTLINGDYVKAVVDTDLKRDDQAGFVYLDATQNTLSLQGQSLSGKLCHGNYGCVNVSTKVLFNIRARTGEINMTGANNSSIQLYYDKATGNLNTRIDGSGTGAYGAPLLVN
jgi:hypothetical protein